MTSLQRRQSRPLRPEAVFASLAAFLIVLALGTLTSPPQGTPSGPISQAVATIDASGSRVMAADKAKNITFDDLKFEIKKEEPFVRSMLTPKIEALHGQGVLVRGWILPQSVFQNKGIKKFILVRDNMECCFGPGAALYDSIQVEMDSGTSADFTTRPIAVEGVFTIREFEIEGKVYSVYHLQAAKAK